MYVIFDRGCRFISISRYFKSILIALGKNPNRVMVKCFTDYLLNKTHKFFLFLYSIRQILCLKVEKL